MLFVSTGYFYHMLPEPLTHQAHDIIIVDDVFMGNRLSCRLGITSPKEEIYSTTPIDAKEINERLCK